MTKAGARCLAVLEKKRILPWADPGLSTWHVAHCRFDRPVENPRLGWPSLRGLGLR
jgi:hypothetical protein